MPPFKLTIDKSKLVGQEVIPAGIYKVRFDSFKPKYSAPKPGVAPGTPTSLNYNAKMEILDRPDLTEKGPRYVYEGLNEKAGWVLQDFCHGFGIPMDTEDGQNFFIPGDWEGEEGKAETYKYSGPLTGKIAEVEIVVISYMGKEQNKVSRYFCSVPGCAQKFPEISHSMNLVKKA